MLYRHVFDKVSTEFHSIFHVFVNFVGFCGFAWISRLRNRAKYQKPCKTDVIQFSPRFVKNPILSDFLIGNASQEYNHQTKFVVLV